MTPATLAARVAAECGPLNNTARERARTLAVEFQIVEIAARYNVIASIQQKARHNAPPPPRRKKPSPRLNHAVEVLRQNPGATTMQLVSLAGVSRRVAQRAISAERKQNECLTNRETFSQCEAQSENV